MEAVPTQALASPPMRNPYDPSTAPKGETPPSDPPPREESKNGTDASENLDNKSARPANGTEKADGLRQKLTLVHTEKDEIPLTPLLPAEDKNPNGQRLPINTNPAEDVNGTTPVHHSLPWITTVLFVGGAAVLLVGIWWFLLLLKRKKEKENEQSY